MKTYSTSSKRVEDYSKYDKPYGLFHNLLNFRGKSWGIQYEMISKYIKGQLSQLPWLLSLKT